MPTLRPRKRNPESQSASETTATSTSSLTPAAVTKRNRPATRSSKKRVAVADDEDEMSAVTSDEERRPLLDGLAGTETAVPAPLEAPETKTWAQRNQWIVFALASGGCAAFNGVFAKLTTTELTTKLSMGLARLLGLEHVEGVIEVIVRGSFFGLNLVFNGIMWTLFTTALARGNSTTQVSIMNTSANFVLTAILGFAIFSEALPPLWWLGAALLVAGNVIIGRKDEGKEEAEAQEDAGQSAAVPASADDGGLGARVNANGGVANEVDDGYKDEDLADLRI
ncbi:uncharacterized protein C8A04DRAFT_14372 [Dichotomopilus funicola]|uniref:Transmembrane protein 42 n=1 Tax=Dichotomopilus funicola TaxID=1934379 RepID=A0AAN6UXR9_9PEZI|nr:hypothetical protein C8A04DRAFT_14372 [Dichotomopilus funicola]